MRVPDFDNNARELQYFLAHCTQSGWRDNRLQAEGLVS